MRSYAAQVRSLRRTEESRSESSLLSHINIVLLLLICASTSAFSGWIETAVPLYYSQIDMASLSGVAISIWSIGSIIGIVAFTHCHPKRMATVKQLVLFTGIYGIVCLGLALPLGGHKLVCALFLVGVFVSPGSTLQYRIAGQLAPEGRQGEMFSWVNTAMGVGLALGSYCAGLVADNLGGGLLFLVPVGFVFIALMCAWALCVRAETLAVGRG